MNHDTLDSRWRISAKRTGSAVIICNSKSVGSLGVSVAVAALGKDVPPAAGDFVVRPARDDIRPIAQDDMDMVAHHGKAEHIDAERPARNWMRS